MLNYILNLNILFVSWIFSMTANEIHIRYCIYIKIYRIK